jgi:hypothetical protein
MINFQLKYNKYKNKYLYLKNQIGGNEFNIECLTPILFYDISPDNKYIATIHQHNISIWDNNTYTLHAEFNFDNITFYNKRIESSFFFRIYTKRDSYKDFDSSAFAWSPNSQYFAVSGNNFDLTIRENQSLSNTQTTDEIIIIDCLTKKIIKRYKSDEVVKKSNVINTISWKNTSTELLSISFIEQKVIKWDLRNDEKQIIFNDNRFSYETRIVVNDDFSLIMHIKKNGQSYTLLIIKDLDYRKIYTIDFDGSAIHDCYFSKTNKDIIFIISEYESQKILRQYDISPFIKNNEQESSIIYEYKFNREIMGMRERNGINYNCSPNLDYVYLCNNGNKCILNTKSNKLIEINYDEIYSDPIIWSDDSKYFYYLIGDEIIFINLDNEITISIINVDFINADIKLSNDEKLFFLTAPNKIKIMNVRCLLKEKIIFIDDDNKEFLKTEIINTMIHKLDNPLYKLQTNTLYSYVNQKTNLDLKIIENIFNNKEKRLWFFTDKRNLSDIFVFPTLNRDKSVPTISDDLLSNFQKSAIINEIQKKNIIHKNKNWGDSQNYIQANYFSIFYGYLTDFSKFNEKVKYREEEKQVFSAYYIFDAETLIKETIHNIFNSYKEYDSNEEHIQEWSTQNMIYFNKGWRFGRIGKKEEFGHPKPMKDYSVSPPKKYQIYITEDTTLCDTIKFSDNEEIKNLKIIKFINKLICKIKDIPPVKIDKNEICIRFPIGVNLSNGLFKISLPYPNKPYTITTEVDLPFNPSS